MALPSVLLCWNCLLDLYLLYLITIQPSSDVARYSFILLHNNPHSKALTNSHPNFWTIEPIAEQNLSSFKELVCVLIGHFVEVVEGRNILNFSLPHWWYDCPKGPNSTVSTCFSLILFENGLPYNLQIDFSLLLESCLSYAWVLCCHDSSSSAFDSQVILQQHSLIFWPKPGARRILVVDRM